jgi:hypothetical protein
VRLKSRESPSFEWLFAGYSRRAGKCGKGYKKLTSVFLRAFAETETLWPGTHPAKPMCWLGASTPLPKREGRRGLQTQRLVGRRFGFGSRRGFGSGRVYAFEAGGSNLAQDGGEVVFDAVVGEAEGAAFVGLEDSVALSVVVRVESVHFAVELDGETGGVAVEVDDEAVKRLLATEVEVGKAVGAQFASESPLETSLRVAQSAS